MEQLFVPQKPPEDKDQLNEYIWRMLRDIAQNLESIADGRIIEKRHVAPSKPRDGMIAYADGTNWNPGAGGEGLYYFKSGTWTLIV